MHVAESIEKLPQELVIPNDQIRLLDSIGQGKVCFVVLAATNVTLPYYSLLYNKHATATKYRKVKAMKDQCKMLATFCSIKSLYNCCLSIPITGEFGIVYKAHLLQWHGQGSPEVVAVKALKGTFHSRSLNQTTLLAGCKNTV